MALTEVQMTSAVWLTCVTHALSTETEEVMGVLLGDVEVGNLPDLADLQVPALLQL